MFNNCRLSLIFFSLHFIQKIFNFLRLLISIRQLSRLIFVVLAVLQLQFKLWIQLMNANGTHATSLGEWISWFNTCRSLADIVELRKPSGRCLIEDACRWAKVGDTLSRFERLHDSRRNTMGTRRSIGRERRGFLDVSLHFRKLGVHIRIFLCFTCALKDRILWINNEFTIVARQGRVPTLRSSRWIHHALPIHALRLKYIWCSWRHLRIWRRLFELICLIFRPRVFFWHLILLWPHLSHYPWLSFKWTGGSQLDALRRFRGYGLSHITQLLRLESELSSTFRA